MATLPRVRLKSVSGLFPALCGRGWRHDAGDTGGRVRNIWLAGLDNGQTPAMAQDDAARARLPRGNAQSYGDLHGMRLPAGGDERNDTRVTARCSSGRNELAARVDWSRRFAAGHTGAASIVALSRADG